MVYVVGCVWYWVGVLVGVGLLGGWCGCGGLWVGWGCCGRDDVCGCVGVWCVGVSVDYGVVLWGLGGWVWMGGWGCVW